MHVRETSIDVYHQIEAEGLLSVKRWEVYQTLYHHGPLTATEIATRMPGLKSPSKGNNVHARLCELREMAAVREVGERQCSMTNNIVILWDVTGEVPREFNPKASPTKTQVITALLEVLEVPYAKLKAIEAPNASTRAWLEKTEAAMAAAKPHDKRRKGHS